MIRIIFFLFFCSMSFTHSTYAANQYHQIKKDLGDSVITTKITAKYTKDRDLNPLKIRVTTQQGIVTLKGHVKNNASFVKALRLAKETKGVKAVETDELVIKPVNTAITDAYITAKVEADILKAKVFEDESIPLVGISAKTNNGTVTLAGQVKSQHSVLAIVKWTNKVHGVKKIISHLEVHATK